MAHMLGMVYPVPVQRGLAGDFAVSSDSAKQTRDFAKLYALMDSFGSYRLGFSLYFGKKYHVGVGIDNATEEEIGRVKKAIQDTRFEIITVDKIRPVFNCRQGTRLG